MKLLTKLTLLYCVVTFVSCKRIRESIYEPLQGISFCFKRANGTHEMGCSSELNGNVGVVHLILEPEDSQWLIQQGPHEPYIGNMHTCLIITVLIVQTNYIKVGSSTYY